MADGGSVQDIEGLDEDTKEVFKTFKEINQLELVRQAGIRQQYIDQSVSLNLAFPAEATPKWINQVHLDAWKKGIKTLPEPAIDRIEYDLKDELIRQTIMDTQEDVEEIKETIDKIDERLYEIQSKQR